MFAFAQALHRLPIAGVDEQLKTANPLEGDDFSFANLSGRLSKRGIALPENCRLTNPTIAVAARKRGQAVGSAWKRRSVGSRYSRAQSAHIANFFIAVLARS